MSKECKEKVSVEQFVWAVVKARKDGRSTQQLANQLGLTYSTVYQRMYELRKSGVPLPKLCANSRLTVAERAKEVLKQARKKGML